MSPFTVICLTIAVCGGLTDRSLWILVGILGALAIEVSLAWARSDNASA